MYESNFTGKYILATIHTIRNTAVDSTFNHRITMSGMDSSPMPRRRDGRNVPGFSLLGVEPSLSGSGIDHQIHQERLVEGRAHQLDDDPERLVLVLLGALQDQLVMYLLLSDRVHQKSYPVIRHQMQALGRCGGVPGAAGNTRDDAGARPSVPSASL